QIRRCSLAGRPCPPPAGPLPEKTTQGGVASDDVFAEAPGGATERQRQTRGNPGTQSYGPSLLRRVAAGPPNRDDGPNRDGRNRAMRGRILLTGVIVTALAGFTAAASVASFTAETTNPTNKFATGTLVLSNKVN